MSPTTQVHSCHDAHVVKGDIRIRFDANPIHFYPYPSRVLSLWLLSTSAAATTARTSRAGGRTGGGACDSDSGGGGLSRNKRIAPSAVASPWRPTHPGVLDGCCGGIAQLHTGVLRSQWAPTTPLHGSRTLRLVLSMRGG